MDRVLLAQMCNASFLEKGLTGIDKNLIISRSNLDGSNSYSMIITLKKERLEFAFTNKVQFTRTGAIKIMVYG
jgi:hypothetical protein